MIVDETLAIAEFKLAAVRYARSLPPPQGRVFLKGLLLCASENVDDIRVAYTALCQSDDQLELIASEQLKFRELLGGAK